MWPQKRSYSSLSLLAAALGGFGAPPKKRAKKSTPKSPAAPAAPAAVLDGKNWWSCAKCLKEEKACSVHSQTLLGDQAARKVLQNRLSKARADLRKAQNAVNDLEDAVMATKGGSSSATTNVVLEHSGWKDDNDEGFEDGRLPISLALEAEALSASDRKDLCNKLLGLKLRITTCQDRCFQGNIAIPGKILERLPPRPGQVDLKPGAVLLQNGKMTIYLRICKKKENEHSKLLGFVTNEGLKAMKYKHTANKKYRKACVYCWRSCYIEFTMEKVYIEGDDESSATNNEEENEDDVDGIEEEEDAGNE